MAESGLWKQFKGRLAPQYFCILFLLHSDLVATRLHGLAKLSHSFTAMVTA